MFFSSLAVFLTIREVFITLLVKQTLANIPLCIGCFLNTIWTERDIGVFCYSSGDIRNNTEYLAGKTNSSNRFYSRVVTNQLRYGPLSKDFIIAPSPVNIYAGNAQDLYRLGINSLATDYIGTDESKDHIWSWRRDLDVKSLGQHFRDYCVVMEKDTGLWNVELCSSSLHVLCKNNTDPMEYVIGALVSNPQLILSELHGNRLSRESSHVCPFGYSFKPPITT